MLRSSGPPPPKLHATTRSFRRRASSTIWCERLFDAESVGVAVADSTPAGTGEQECFTELQATRGIAFSTKAGVAAYVDLEKFAGGSR